MLRPGARYKSNQAGVDAILADMRVSGYSLSKQSTDRLQDAVYQAVDEHHVRLEPDGLVVEVEPVEENLIEEICEPECKIATQG